MKRKANIYDTDDVERSKRLLFFGDKIIPFIDKFPTDTKLYQVMTTKPADLAE